MVNGRPTEGAAIVRVAGALALPVRYARCLCVGTFSVSIVCLAYSAISVLPSAAFQSFAVPALFGVLMGVMILGVLLVHEEPGSSADVAELLAKLGSVTFVGVTLSRVLPQWTTAGWWSVAGGGLMLLSLVLLAELLKTGGTISEGGVHAARDGSASAPGEQ